MPTYYAPAMTDAYLAYAAHSLRYHDLQLRNDADTSAAEGLEEEMSAQWSSLDDVQRKSLSGIGSDLIWIRSKAVLAPRGRKLEEIEESDKRMLLEATKSNDYHAVLHHLRICAAAVSPEKLAFARGGAYRHAGLPRLGAIFHDFAAELDKNNGAIGVLALRALDQLDPEMATRRSRAILDSLFPYPPVVVVLCVGTLLERSRQNAPPTNTDYYANIILKAIDRLDLEPSSRETRAMVYQLAGSNFEVLGRADDAIRWFEEGLKLSPDNDVMLVGAGALKYRADPDQAVKLLEKAIKLKSSLVYPYYLLAHFHLRRRDFGQSLRYIQLASRFAEAEEVKAELLAWSAICQEGMLPEDTRRSLFEKAKAMSQSSSRIAKNLGSHGAGAKKGEFVDWEIDIESSRRLGWNRDFQKAMAQ